VSEPRRYFSPKRQANAAATRSAILDAFVEQLSEHGRDNLSPSEAASRAGVSVRTVHLYFPNLDSQVLALGEWFDRHLYPNGVAIASDADDLPRYFREIHANALASPLSRALATSRSQVWQEVRQRRRRKRLDAIREAVKAVGAPPAATEDATAMLLRLSGADASWPLHDLYGLPLDRVPDVIANIVELIVGQLRTQAVDQTYKNPKQPDHQNTRAPAQRPRPAPARLRRH
jgi:AcrR family transcriptional regulator